MTRKRWSGCLMLGIAALVAGAMASQTVAEKPGAEWILHVAPTGDDRQPGTRDRPFASLTRARDEIRAIRKKQGGSLKQPVTVWIHGGTYRLHEPFELTPEDSGSADCPVTYAAASGEKPILSGGQTVSGWKPTRVAGRALWMTEIDEVKKGKWNFHQLWVNGVRRPRARHPNHGFLEVAGLPDPPVKGVRRQPGTKRFRYKEGDLRVWENLAEVDLVALHLWVSVRLGIARLDEKERIVHLVAPSLRRLVDGPKPARYYIENALELLDAPGEWYLDRTSGKLYYLPAEGEKFPEATVLAPVQSQLVRFAGEPARGRFVEHVTLRGLTLAHTEVWPARDQPMDIQAAATVPAMLHGDGMRQCRIDRCRFAHAGTYGIHLARGCVGNRIEHCELVDLGAGGIRIGETIQRPAEQERTHDNVISDNHVHEVSKIFHQAVGIWIGQSYSNRIVHNHIHDLTYTGISCGWTWGYGNSLAQGNLIEKNHVHDIGKGLLSDMGGIYTLGKQPGTIIRHNCFHDISAYQYGGWGIYFDEGSTDILAEGNLVYRTTNGGFHQHYGKDNVVRNNIFALGKFAQIRRTRVEAHTSFRFERNLVYWTEGKLLDGNWDDSGYRMDRNLYDYAGKGEVNFGKWTFSQWQERGQDQRSLLAGPLFLAPEKADFRLRKESPTQKIGFIPLRLEDLGPRPLRGKVSAEGARPNRPGNPPDQPN